jgi:hypothetical protein
MLERAAKLVKIKTTQQQSDGDEDGVGTDPYGEDDFEQDEEDSSSSSDGALELTNSKAVHLARSEVCEAFAKICEKLAIEADASLRLRARKSAEEWLVGRDGAARLQERINDLTKRYLEANAAKAAKTAANNSSGNNNNGTATSTSGGWKKSTNAATMRHEAEGRARSQLLKEATADVQEQLVEQGEATSEMYHKKVVDWLTRSWEYREATYGSRHPETVLAYERLGRAHLKAGRSTLTNKNRTNNSGVVSSDARMEHVRQAVSMLETALRLAAETEAVGSGSATHARIAQLLSKACESLGRFKDAGSLLRDAGAFYESEANRSVRCLVRPEEDEDSVPIIIDQNGKKLVLPPSVGALAAAEKSRSLYRESMKLLLKSPMASTDDEVEIGTETVAVLKHSVRVSATHFGAGSVECAQDLARLGALCHMYGWDVQLAKESLSQAKNIFMQHGSSKDAEKVNHQLRKMKRNEDGVERSSDTSWLM